MKVIDKSTGKIYDSIAQACHECEWIKCHKRTLQKHIKRDGCFNSIYPYISGNMETESTSAKNAPVHRIHEVYTEEELDRLIEIKNKQGEFEVFEIKSKPSKKCKRAAIAVLSDIHAEEKIDKESVLGLNEYSTFICKERVSNFFTRLVKIMERNTADHLYLGIIGDLINGYLREEAMQENNLTPLQSTHFVKGLLVSGLNYLLDNLKIHKITVVCCVGNHSRTSPRLQVANNWSINYEFFMLSDIAEIFKDNKKIEFVIPKSEACITNILGQRVLWTHGSSIKGGSGISGIYNVLMRYYHKLNSVFNIDLIICGHLHQLTFTDKVIVNGSVCGYSPFSMSCGFPFQEPQQAFFIIDEKFGRRVMCPIYLK